MKKSTVLAYFGGVTKTANALKVKQPSVSLWPDELPFSVLGRIAHFQPEAWRDLAGSELVSKPPSGDDSIE